MTLLRLLGLRDSSAILATLTNFDWHWHCFPAKLLKSKNMHIIKTIASIPTKFCTVIKTTRFPLWAVQTRSSQIQDGGRPPSWKNRQIATSQQRFDRSTRYLVRWRTLFVLTLSTPKICTFLKSKMPAAAMLKNRKMAISQQRFDWSTRNLARWCILAVSSLSAPKISTFSKSKMAAAAILKNRKMAISQQRFDHLREIWHDIAFWPSWAIPPLKVPHFQNPRWRWRHLEK